MGPMLEPGEAVVIREIVVGLCYRVTVLIEYHYTEIPDQGNLM